MNRSYLIKTITKGYRIFTGFCLSFSLFMVSNVSAGTPVKSGPPAPADQTIISDNHGITMSAHIATGVLNGESREFAYNTSNGAKLSELIWTIDNVMMANFGLTLTTPRWLNVNLDFWFNLTDNAEMDDYDWFVTGLPWTHWSNHPDTTLTSGTMLDINGEINIIAPSEFTLFAIVGFKRDNWSWDAKGGTYIYSVNGFRDSTGTFPSGQKVISYEQYFNVPYLGLGFGFGTTSFKVKAKVFGSPYLWAGQTDDHYLRNLRFESDLSGGTMIGVDIAAFYYFTENFAVSLGVFAQSYSELKGEETITDTSTGQSYKVSGDPSGFDHESAMFSFGLHYRF